MSMGFFHSENSKDYRKVVEDILNDQHVFDYENNLQKIIFWSLSCYCRIQILL
jgi:hypothetical protein